MDERFLVTGSGGCIGAWVVAQLVAEGTEVVALDASDDDHRLRLLLAGDELDAPARVRGDITDLEALERVLDEQRITHAVHLAALQVPFCRADPPLGARVNVVGTVNVFEAVARRRDRMAGPVVYASSIAAYDALDEGEDHTAMEGAPSTIYGVYKRANEGTATVYAAERDVPSVGLRPHTVYGPGRDQGLTSAPTVAMLHAAAGRRYTIPFGGSYQMQYAPDVAAAFVAAARRQQAGAVVEDLGGPTVSTDEVIEAIAAVAPDAEIDFEPVALPFPSATGSPAGGTSLRDGVADTFTRFRTLLERGLVTLP
ncbi:MAG TPA: NAD-dependent epimerase/dehydratase family protein [Solirubrobacteraceae bacterium]|nr:NAD-dependent epimerase/dehydratase family protein [Solirubrobacteraceae bacterium]